MILNRAKSYENNKKRLRKQEIITETYLKKTKIKRENMEGRNRHHIMSEEKKQKLKEYQKNYRETKKLK